MAGNEPRRAWWIHDQGPVEGGGWDVTLGFNDGTRKTLYIEPGYDYATAIAEAAAAHLAGRRISQRAGRNE